MASRTASRTLTDHEEIRQWAEERGAAPACVRGTGGAEDTGMIRLDFPGYSGEQSLEPIGWDDWFRKFDESKLALLVQDETAGGERSNFNKLIGRETARARSAGDNRASRRHPERGHRATSRQSTKSTSARRSATARGARKNSSRSGSPSSRTRSTSSRSARTSASSSRTKQAGSSRSANASKKSTRNSSSRGKTKSSSRTRTSQSAPSAQSRRGARSSSSGSRSQRASKSATNRFLTGHEEIRRWAEERDAKPACVRGTGSSDDLGMIRLDFPGYTGEQSLEHVNWDEWFQKFDERGLALLVQGGTARGQKSNFNKLVSRETAGESGKSARSTERKSSGTRTSGSRRRAA